MSIVMLLFLIALYIVQILTNHTRTQLAGVGAVEYTDCISAEE